jgi:hypothetical protein
VHYDVFIDPGKQGEAKVTASAGDIGRDQNVPVLPGATATLGPGPVYQIEIFRPPLVRPPNADLTIRVPSGWRVAASNATIERGAEGGAQGSRVLLRGQPAVQIRIVRTGLAGLWNRLWSH